jgi:hypothetical protein
VSLIGVDEFWGDAELVREVLNVVADALGAGILLRVDEEPRSVDVGEAFVVRVVLALVLVVCVTELVCEDDFLLDGGEPEVVDGP